MQSEDKEKQNISMKEILTKRSNEPITNCNCMKDKEKQIFDKYGNYNFLTEIKQEGLNVASSQIEEMAQYLKGYLYPLDNNSIENCRILASALITQGWVKIPEDSVVLSINGWINFNKDHANELIKAREEDYSLGYEKGSKETVEKFIRWLKENILSWGVCGNGKIKGTISITLDELEKFSKQFGDFENYFRVEIKE